MKSLTRGVKKLSGTTLEIGFGVFMFALVLSSGRPAPVQAKSLLENAKVPSIISASVVPAQPICLVDNINGNRLSYDKGTGAYCFSSAAGFTLNGTGTIRTVNSIVLLSDSKPDRRVSAGFYTGQLTGSAVLFVQAGAGVWRTFTINDTASQGKGTCPCGKGG